MYVFFFVRIRGLEQQRRRPRPAAETGRSCWGRLLDFAHMDEENRAELDESRPIIPRVLKEDKLLHYPYESIRPFLQLLNEAARDPEVVSIKMPLYCLASHSKVVDALVEAAENGKQGMFWLS